MHILHGTWIPESGTDDFIQSGQFYLWVETTENQRDQTDQERHPQQLAADDLVDLLTSEFKIQSPDRYPLADVIEPCYFLLPTVEGQPLPSLELSRYLEIELPDTFGFDYWEIDCCPILGAAPLKSKAGPNSLIPLLNELHFLALHNLSEIQLGADLLFWFHFTQALKRVILKDHYIPALKYRPLEPFKVGKGTSNRRTAAQPAEFEIYSGWEFIGEEYETLLGQYVDHMPLMCAAGFADPYEKPWLYDRRSLLGHFSEGLLTEIVAHTQFTKAFETTISDSVLHNCLDLDVWPQSSGLETYQQWQAWRDRIVRTQTDQPFYLYFHLQDPPNPNHPWQLQFQVAPKDDPSLKVALGDYWRMRSQQQKQVKKQLGGDFEQNLLLNLGYAARIYPELWPGLETDQPVGINLTLEAAFSFLKESAWVLENAGYKVIVPAWWTPQGRQRAKVKLKAKGKSLSEGEDKSKSYFSLNRLVEYEYELAIGGEHVTEKEWHQLVNAKTPLVKFRGQWMELDQDKMQQMLQFWKNHQQENPELSLLEFMKLTAGGNDELEVECDRKDALADMLAKLGDKGQLQPVDDPDNFEGQLREYQKRGVSWLQYLEQLGLNGCLADDMGLGKTVQVIARMVQERTPEKPKKGTRKQAAKEIKLPPTLLIAPTSVVGNWLREIHKFAPQIKATVHHGGERAKDAKTFKQAWGGHDIVITS